MFFVYRNNWLVNEKEYDYEDSDEKKPQDSRTFEWIYVVKSVSNLTKMTRGSSWYFASCTEQIVENNYTLCI